MLHVTFLPLVLGAFSAQSVDAQRSASPASAPLAPGSQHAAAPRVEAESASPVPFAERMPIRAETDPSDPRVEHAWLEAGAAAPGEPPPQPDLARLDAFVPDRAYHAQEPDGTPWVRGATYRARFGAEGASYTPFLGSDAPRSWPVAFSLTNVGVGGEALDYDRSVPALRDLDEISYDRGTLTERYDIGVDSIEQIFVFDELPARGEIVLRIAIDTDLVACETADAIEFANERGTVRYGRATAFDANGASTAATTILVGDEIVIRVPADFVAAASLPLVIDPLISTFSAGSRSVQFNTQDCAFDATYGRWLIVYNERFSFTEDYVGWRLVGALNGQVIAAGYLGDGQWKHARCANLNASNQFLVVAVRDYGGIGQSISAANGALGIPFTIAPSGGYEGHTSNIVVGGDPYAGTPSHFLVAWINRGGTGADEEVRCRLVGPSGPTGNTQVLRGVTADRPLDHLAISKSNGGSTWNLAWRENEYYHSIVGARVSWSGSATSPVTLQLNAPQCMRVAVSPALQGSSVWAFAYESSGSYSPTGFGQDVFVGTVNGLTPVDIENVSLLTELAGTGSRQGEQRDPQLDSDGRSFSVTYIDAPVGQGATEGYLRVGTLTPVGSQLMLSEVVVADYAASHRPAIASTWGAGLAWRLQLAVWGQQSTGAVRAGLYDNALFTSFCHPGYDGVATCPCGNAPIQYGRGCNNPGNTGGAKLYGSGISSVGSDSMSLTALNLPTNQTVFFYQGTAPLSTAVFSGRGVRCVGGTQILLYTKPSTPIGTQAAATAPYAGEVRIAARSAQLGAPIQAGQTRYYYAAYRPVGTSGGGDGTFACTTWQSQTVTQSLQAVWIP